MHSIVVCEFPCFHVQYIRLRFIFEKWFDFFSIQFYLSNFIITMVGGGYSVIRLTPGPLAIPKPCITPRLIDCRRNWPIGFPNRSKRRQEVQRGAIANRKIIFKFIHFFFFKMTSPFFWFIFWKFFSVCKACQPWLKSIVFSCCLWLWFRLSIETADRFGCFASALYVRLDHHLRRADFIFGRMRPTHSKTAEARNCILSETIATTSNHPVSSSFFLFEIFSSTERNKTTRKHKYQRRKKTGSDNTDTQKFLTEKLRLHLFPTKEQQGLCMLYYPWQKNWLRLRVVPRNKRADQLPDRIFPRQMCRYIWIPFPLVQEVLLFLFFSQCFYRWHMIRHPSISVIFSTLVQLSKILVNSLRSWNLVLSICSQINDEKEKKKTVGRPSFVVPLSFHIETREKKKKRSRFKVNKTRKKAEPLLFSLHWGHGKWRY